MKLSEAGVMRGSVSSTCPLQDAIVNEKEPFIRKSHFITTHNFLHEKVERDGDEEGGDGRDHEAVVVVDVIRCSGDHVFEKEVCFMLLGWL